jgi:hypothetical protein
VVVVILVAAGAIGGMLFYFKNNPHASVSNKSTSQSSIGELPMWRTFDNVFNANCLPTNCFGVSNYVSSNCELEGAVLTCTYEGTAYYGYFESGGSVQYCNVLSNGVIPEVNGILVPYLGCVLSRAPIAYLFSDLYTLSGSGSSISMMGPLEGGYLNYVTVYPTDNFQWYSCSVQMNGLGLPTGTLTCNYLGSVYSGTTSSLCNLGTPVQINGVPIPADACMLQRN